ncbi:MAP7 domain-containing protein [Limnohabitans sp. DCL3]|uniref:MAP7 domain-containing protein n=1 Tax=Limnohabitans sp. DCL3 TaxID=3374103 RepID=UPI003A884CFC
MRFQKIFISFFLITTVADLRAAAWSVVSSGVYGVYHIDTDNISGPLNDRKIITKVNFLQDRVDQFKSMLINYSVNCTEETIVYELVRGYAQPDLQVWKTNVLSLQGRRVDFKSNNELKKYADIACNNQTTQNSQPPLDIQNQIVGVAPQSDLSKNTITPQNRLQYFSRNNPEGNVKEAFKVITNEEIDAISWNFAFANDVAKKITTNTLWQNQATVLASAIPIMNEGVSKYLKSFDELASSLGVSRALIMSSFDIKINDNGYAGFVRRVDLNSELNGVTNSYLSFYGAWNKNERDYFERNVPGYYKGRPPANIYTSVLADDLKKIESIKQRVVASAFRIESFLIAKENERIKLEKELAIRRETEEKRIAEERQKREDFLKSPEGQRQIAAEKKAKELAEEMARPKPIDRKKLLQGKEYTYYGDSKCTTEGNKVCLTPADYEHLCRIAKSMTQLAASGLTIFDPAASHLVTNGTTDSLEVSWNGSASSKFKCRATITVSGIYRGSSRRVTSYGGVTQFIINGNNEVLAHSASSSY